MVGIILLLVVFIDALWTTLWVDGGGGPLTTRLTSLAWKATLALIGHRHNRGLSLFGPAIMVLIVMLWGALLWAGWTFVFASGPVALVTGNPPPTPADWADRIWFVAYALSTMGNGDFVPGSDGWQIVASFTTLSSFFLASLVISYLISVLGAVVQKRAFAGQVVGMGPTAETLVSNAWDGQSLRTLDLPLSSASTRLALLSEQYLSYPILQFYHAARLTKAPAVGVVVLDEALTLLRFGVAEDHRPGRAVLHSARSTVGGFLDTLDSAFIDPAGDVPPPPSLDALREAGIPTVDDDEFARAIDDLADRRRRLLGMLRNDGWTWEEGAR